MKARPTWRRATALMPILLLAAALSVFSTFSDQLLAMIGKNPPPADQFEVRRVEFKDRLIEVRVTNPQRDRLTVAQVLVDQAFVGFTVDGPKVLGRLKSTTIRIPYHWTDGEPYEIGIVSQSGIETVHGVDAAVETPQASAKAFLGYGLIGTLVGILPVALGMLWLPGLRTLDSRWLAGFMALTAGLLTFLAFDSLAESLQLQAALPAAFGGTGLILLGLAVSFLGLNFLGERLNGRADSDVRPSREGSSGLRLALLIAVGIGLHNLGEGLAIGTSFALSDLAFGTFLIVGFTVHNITEGLGVVAPIADSGQRVPLVRLAGLSLLAGGPAVLGVWIGGFITSDFLAVLFFAIAAGAALQVVVEVVRYLRDRHGDWRSAHVIGGFIAGLVVMYSTGLLVG